ncbi:MAG: TetR/AcrR family transcriptional regulator [Candidatus Cyclobacteriaceae bacterium M3_2C_046]
MKSTKEHILLHGLRLFLLKSYKAVTIKEIVKSAGISPGFFYHYFTSKAELFNQIMEVFFLANQQELYQIAPQLSLKEFYLAYLNLINKLKNTMKAKLNLKDAMETNYLLPVMEALNHIPAFKTRIQNEHRQELKLWIHIIQNARKNGEIHSTLSDEQIAKIFIYITDGILIKSEGNLDMAQEKIVAMYDSIYQQLIN